LGVSVALPTPRDVPSDTTCPAADHVLTGVAGVVGVVGVVGDAGVERPPPHAANRTHATAAVARRVPDREH
jgi:hypothetical protein